MIKTKLLYGIHSDTDRFVAWCIRVFILRRYLLTHIFFNNNKVLNYSDGLQVKPKLASLIHFLPFQCPCLRESGKESEICTCLISPFSQALAKGSTSGMGIPSRCSLFS